jgi:arsenite methyltransferase
MVDVRELEAKVKDMYRAVAADPHGRFHFELGRHLALRLGYDAARLDAVPGPAVDSFAGVGFFFDLPDLGPGEAVVDLGSGSGMDVFYAAGLVGPGGWCWESTSPASSSTRPPG